MGIAVVIRFGLGRFSLFLECFAGTRFVDSGHSPLVEMFSKVYKQRRVEGPLVSRFLLVQEVLQIRIPPELFHGLLVAGTQALFDDQSSQSHSP